MQADDPSVGPEFPQNLTATPRRPSRPSNKTWHIAIKKKRKQEENQEKTLYLLLFHRRRMTANSAKIGKLTHAWE
jgi:hypothetical protein